MAATVRALVRNGRVTLLCRRCGERLRVTVSNDVAVTRCGCDTER